MNWYKKSITLKKPDLEEDLFDDKSSVVQNLNQAFKKINLDISISLTQQELPEFTVPRVSSLFESICEDIAIQATKCGVKVIDFKRDCKKSPSFRWGLNCRSTYQLKHTPTR